MAVCQSRGTAMPGQTSEREDSGQWLYASPEELQCQGRLQKVKTQDSGCMPVQGNCMLDQTSEK